MSRVHLPILALVICFHAASVAATPITDFAGAEFISAHPNNFSDTDRNASEIDTIVLHTISLEKAVNPGTLTSAVNHFQDPNAQVSAHYIVGRDGRIVQMVKEQDIAFHGQPINGRSIGIELEGAADDPGLVTDELARASVSLTRNIAQRQGIPIDRSHIIGHSEIPGHTAGKTDPGPFWDWEKFMNSMLHPIDLIFAIDLTGSMSDDIEAVSASAVEIINGISDKLYDYRVGIVTYKDFPVFPFGELTDFPSATHLPFSTDKDEIIANLQSLPSLVGGGGDFEESVYSALMHGILSLDLGGWRGFVDGIPVSKNIILMGDAPPHDPEPFTGLRMDDVLLAAFNADPVEISSIAVGNHPLTTNSFSALAAGSDGSFFTASNADAVVPALLSALEDITSPTSVPEPSMLLLLALGLGIVVFTRRDSAYLMENH